jgi:hypothetical protein
LQQARRWFTLFFLPIFPVSKPIGDQVQCTTCHTSFRPEVLDAPTSEEFSENLRGAIRVAAIAMLKASDPHHAAARHAAITAARETGLEHYEDAWLANDLDAIDTSTLDNYVRSLATGLNDVRFVAVDTKSAYVTQYLPGAIARVDKVDGGATAFASGVSFPWRIVVSAGEAFYTTSTTVGAVRACALDAGTCPAGGATIAANQVNPDGVSVSTTETFFALGAGSVYRCPLAGCGATPTPVLTSSFQLRGIALDATNVYIADYYSNELKSCPKTGCVPLTTATSVAKNVAGAYSLAVSGTTLFAAGLGSIGGGFADGSIVSCPVTGCGATPTVIASSQQSPADLAVDTTNVYWTTGSQGGASGVATCPLTGCPPKGPRVLAKGLNKAWGIALDDKAIYFTEQGAGKVWKVAK